MHGQVAGKNMVDSITMCCATSPVQHNTSSNTGCVCYRELGSTHFAFVDSQQTREVKNS